EVDEARMLSFSIRSEGTDLNPADNSTKVKVVPAKPVVLTAARRQVLKHGVAATFTLGRFGSAHVVVRFIVHGCKVVLKRTVKGARVTLRATAAKLCALRHAVPVTGTISIGTESVPIRLR